MTLITGCVLYNNAQAGILWGTGNAIVNVISCDVFCNGWAGSSFSAGDYWRGSIYYDTSTKKLRVNTGGSNWEDLN